MTLKLNYIIVSCQIDPAKLEQKANETVKSDIWFKFKEGYSNAVRRNIKMKDIM